MTEAADDAEQVRRILGGDSGAWVILYERHKKAVLRIAVAMVGLQDAEDVLQETFSKLFQRLRHFDPELGTLKAYISAIARNAARDCLQTRLKLGRPFDKKLEDEIGAEAAKEPEGLEEVRRWVELYPDQLGRKIFLLHLALKSDKEIESDLHRPGGTVRAYKSQVRAFIREKMRSDQQRGDDPGMS